MAENDCPILRLEKDSSVENSLINHIVISTYHTVDELEILFDSGLCGLIYVVATKAYKRIYVATCCGETFPAEDEPKAIQWLKVKISDSKNNVELLVEYKKITNRRILKLNVRPSAAFINKHDFPIIISYIDDLDILKDKFDSHHYGLISRTGPETGGTYKALHGDEIFSGRSESGVTTLLDWRLQRNNVL